jgi:cytochrome c5
MSKSIPLFLILALVRPQNGAAQQPPSDSYQYYGRDLTPAQSRGRDTWYFWTGGGEHMWRQISKITQGQNDLLLYAESQPREKRFQVLGAINDPDCHNSGHPDQYGLNLDVCTPMEIPGIPGESTGIMGLRKFPNPDFKPELWNVDQFRAHPDKIEPPYLVGMACALCHVGFSPLHPPADPASPKWGNLASTIGNQYWREGRLFSFRLKPDNFFWQVGEQQPPGTSDTSRTATDHIFNPNAINTVVYLKERPTAVETFIEPGTSNIVSQPVHHILKAGDDSVGTAFAALRVYVNIGMCSDYWLSLHDPVFGETRNQSPFRIETARKTCEKWRETEAKMPDLEAFLDTAEPMHLKDADGGAAFVTQDRKLLDTGKRVFAENCASCHSSKQPPADVASDAAKKIEWLRQAVMRDDFLDGNFLSDDKRYPVTLIGTNFSRAAGSNPAQGHIWEEFSSKDYKQLPQIPEIIDLYNPVKPGKPIAFQMPAGGKGYYRTPSIVDAWATAPFFNNNSLGIFTGDPSIAGRLKAYQDAMEKLLWPERRPGVKSILRTTANCDIIINGETRFSNLKAGTPIKLLASFNTVDLPEIAKQSWFTSLLNRLLGRKTYNELLLDRNLAPDFIEDRGHEFGSQLSDDEKRALIEYVKTF